MEAQDVIEVSLVDVEVLVLSLRLLLLQQLDVDLHPFLDTIVSDGPPSSDAIAKLSLLDAHDEVTRALTHSLLEVLQQLPSIFAEVDIDALGLCLQDPVLVHQDEPHYQSNYKKQYTTDITNNIKSIIISKISD